MNDKPTILVGKYFFMGMDEYYTYGKIIEVLNSEFMLVEKFGCEKPYTCIFHMSQLTDGMNNKHCQLFVNKTELDEYLEWIEDEEKEIPMYNQNVVRMVKKNDDL